jgi:hypothetical protein
MNVIVYPFSESVSFLLLSNLSFTKEFFVYLLMYEGRVRYFTFVPALYEFVFVLIINLYFLLRTLLLYVQTSAILLAFEIAWF